jgi:hypothetical protein
MFRQKKIRQGSLGKSILLPKIKPPKVTAQNRVLGNSTAKPGALAMQPRFRALSRIQFESVEVFPHAGLFEKIAWASCTRPA